MTGVNTSMSEDETPSCLNAALALLELGCSVIPIKPGGKTPLLGKWRQYQDRRPTEAEVQQWYRDHPEANLGIVTGANSGIVVVDVDGEEGANSMRSLPLADMAPSPTVRSGRGFHSYFKHPGFPVRNSASKVMPGIDVRGDGGYIVAPPSIHESGHRYEWIKGYELGAIPLAELPIIFLGSSESALAPQYVINGTSFADAPSGLTYESDGGREARYAEAALSDECARVAAAQFGAQEDTLNKAALKIGGFVGGGMLDFGRAKHELVSAALAMANQPGREPWTERDVSKKVEHGLRDGVRQPRDLPRETDRNANIANIAKTPLPPANIGSSGNFGTGVDLAASRFASLDLSIASNNLRPAPSFPTEVLGDFWVDFVVRCAEAAGAPVDYIATALLTNVSAIIGNARWVSPWDGWTQSPHLWAALVGNPSSGKSPAFNQFKPALRKVEEQWTADFPERMREWQTEAEAAAVEKRRWEEAVENAVREGKEPPKKPTKAVPPPQPIKPRLQISDATIEVAGGLLSAQHRGLLLHRDELAGWLGSMNKYGGQGADRAFWLEAYSGGPYQVDRVKLGGEPIEVPYMTVSVLGTIQPGKLADTLLAETDDGMAARFLWCWPDPVPPRRPSRAVQWLPIEVAFENLSKLEMTPPNNGRGPASPRVLRLTDEAVDIFSDWRMRNYHEENRHAGLMVSHLGKMPGYVLRLGLVIECLYWQGGEEPREVGRAAIEAAIRLVDEYWKPMAERAFGDAALPELERHARAVARWMLKTRPSVVNARELQRSVRLPGLSNAKAVGAALEELVQAGWLQQPSAADDFAKRAGRPRKDFEVNPLLYQDVPEPGDTIH